MANCCSHNVRSLDCTIDVGRFTVLGRLLYNQSPALLPTHHAPTAHRIKSVASQRNKPCIHVCKIAGACDAHS